MSDLRALVSSLAAQQPLLARTYEVEGLKRALLDLQAGARSSNRTANFPLELCRDVGSSALAMLMEELKHYQERAIEWQARMGKCPKGRGKSLERWNFVYR